MARSRMVKPEFFNDEKLASLSRDSRIVFVGLWVMSDDYGVVKGHNRWLQAQVFPYDLIKPEVFDAWMKELETAGFFVRFEHSGEKFLYLINFTKHQKVDRPSKSRNPAPPKDILNHQTNTLDTHSRERGEDSEIRIDQTEKQKQKQKQKVVRILRHSRVVKLRKMLLEN